MKRAITFILRLSLLFIIHPASAEEDHEYADARGTADFMQEHYGITILIGPECEGITADSFTIGDKPKGRTPLFDGAGLYLSARFLQPFHLVGSPQRPPHSPGEPDCNGMEHARSRCHHRERRLLQSVLWGRRFHPVKYTP